VSELLRLNNIGSKGVNTDVSAVDLPPEFLTHGNNFRIYAGKLISAGGSKVWTTAPVMFYPAHIESIGSTSGAYWLVLGRTHAYTFDGSTWVDVTSLVGYTGLSVDDELNWTSCMLGKYVIANNPQSAPEYWTPDVVPELTPLQFDADNTWSESGKRFKIIRSHKTFLFALYLYEGSQELPDSYRWSTAADVNGLPFTWDETDLSAIAGIASLGGDGGAIIDGLSLRDAFVIYSETSIDILDFAGGDFIWKRRELSSSSGLLSTDCIVEVKGVHYFISAGDILRNDGTNITSIMHGRIKRKFTASISNDYYSTSFAFRNDSYKEIWFCVPVDGATLPNVAFIYNHHDDSWAIRDLPTGTTHANFGSQTEAGLTWDNWQGTWDSQSGIWGSRNLTPLDDTVVGVIRDTSELVLLDPQDSADSVFSPTVLERTDFPLLDHREVTTITRVYPHMEGSTPVKIEIGSQDYAFGPVRWKPAVIFNPEQDRKIDLRSTGSLHCFRFTSIDTGTPIGSGNWYLSGLDFSYELAGRR